MFIAITPNGSAKLRRSGMGKAQQRRHQFADWGLRSMALLRSLNPFVDRVAINMALRWSLERHGPNTFGE